MHYIFSTRKLEEMLAKCPNMEHIYVNMDDGFPCSYEHIKRGTRLWFNILPVKVFLIL